MTAAELLRRGLAHQAQSRKVEPHAVSHYSLVQLASLTAQLATADTRKRRTAQHEINKLIELGKEVNGRQIATGTISTPRKGVIEHRAY